ncbi:methylene-fatty-acyl-phospholipid synthase [Botrytis cinerea]
MTSFLGNNKGLVDFDQKSLTIAAASIAFNPIFWNPKAPIDIIAQFSEYHNKILTKLFNGNSRYGCYFLAVTIFSLGIFRDFLYERALRSQPTHPLLLSPLVQYASYALLAAGNTLVLSSMWALGVTGTYLGDYFGILMDKMVTASRSIASLGKPAGILLTVEVLVVYLVALRFEDPFTAGIYAKREKERSGKKGKKGL